MENRLGTYEEFWPFYVAQHRHPVNRALHFLGTTLSLAWGGHFFFEKNRPATFTYPLWSLRGDFRMYRLIWRGRMAPEIRRAQELFPAGA